MNFLHRTNWATILGAGLALGSCVSARSGLNNTPSATITNRLPALEISLEAGPLANSDGAWPEDPLRVFQKEIAQNVAEPTDTAAYGFAKLVVTEARLYRANRGLLYTQMATLMIPSAFGLPLETYKSDIKAEVQILDAEGTVVGSYAGQGHSSVKVAAYHGYSQSDAPRLADVTALREALAQIRPQLDSASTRLRSRLLAGGPVDNPTLPGLGQPTATGRR